MLEVSGRDVWGEVDEFLSRRKVEKIGVKVQGSGSEALMGAGTIERTSKDWAYHSFTLLMEGISLRS